MCMLGSIAVMWLGVSLGYELVLLVVSMVEACSGGYDIIPIQNPTSIQNMACYACITAGSCSEGFSW